MSQFIVYCKMATSNFKIRIFNRLIIINNNKMRTNRIGKYRLFRTLGEGSFAKVKCKIAN